MACASTVTCGLSRAIAAAALSTFGWPTIGRGVNDLPLQIRQRHRVIVDDAERADAGRGEIQQYRRAEPAGADDEHARALERGLSRPADFAQHDMARIALEFFAR